MNARTLRFPLMFLFALQLMVVGVWAQQKQTITGVVKDNSTGEAMVGVTIIDLSTNNGAVTDIDGGYSIKAAPGTKLEFSYVGMKTEQREVLDQKVINVSLDPDAVDVETVMVVAYGTAKKSSFTGSAEVVGEKQLENRPVSNITKALDGNVAGVETTSGGGQPGGGSQILIRGIGSINASSTPLYVVDGAPFDGSVTSLNPQDIASMTVLKDASATALYGSRAANGVIVITTKRGKAGRAIINFKGSVGVMSRTNSEYDRLNQAEFMEANYDYVRFNLMNKQGMSEEQANQQALATYMTNLGGERYNPFNVNSAQLIDPSTGKVVDGAVSRWQDDWQDAAMRKVAIRQDYQLSASGGTENTTFSMSVGYLNEQGIAENSDYQRFTARVGVDSRIKPWVRTYLSANYANMKTNNGASSGSTFSVWAAGMMMAPIYPVFERDMDGNYVLDVNGEKVYDFGATRPNQKNFNSVALLYQDQSTNKADEVGVRAQVDFGDKNAKSIGFLRDFTLQIKYSMDYRQANNHTFYNPFTGNAVTTNGKMIKDQNQMISNTFGQYLYYEKKVNGHNISAMLGHEFYDYSSETLSGARTGFMYSNSSILNQGTVVSAASSTLDREMIESYLLNANYNYKDRYFFSGSMRTDGSSRFYKDNRWGLFWSVGGSWRMTEERFMRSSRRWLDNLTVKASYGCNGNNKINTLYAWQQTYSYAYPNGYYPGVFVSQIGNKDLKWETNYNLNVGVETRMFKGRFGVTAEYYHRTAKDMLLFRPLATSSGLSGVYENVGSVLNQGVELTFSGLPVVTNDFRWQSTLILSTNFNEVLSLSNGQDQISMGNQIIKVGAPIYSYYFAKSAGVDPETGNELFYSSHESAVNGVTDQSVYADRMLMGSRNPDFRGGFTNIFTYKGFELSFLLNFSVGGKILDNNYINLMSTDKFGNAWHADMARRWRKPGDVTDIPRLENGRAIVASDRYLVSASYLKIQNVTLAYTFNFKNTRNVGISALRLHLSGDNLYTLSARKGMDPQQSLTGTTSFSYAPVSTVSFGVDLTF